MEYTQIELGVIVIVVLVVGHRKMCGLCAVHCAVHNSHKSPANQYFLVGVIVNVVIVGQDVHRAVHNWQGSSVSQ